MGHRAVRDVPGSRSSIADVGFSFFPRRTRRSTKMGIFLFSCHFVPFCPIWFRFFLQPRGLVPEGEGALSLGRVVIFNVIATKAGTSTSAHRGSRLRGNDEKGRWEGSTFNLTTAGGPGQTRRSAPTITGGGAGQTRRSAPTITGGGAGQTHRSAPTRGKVSYAIANQRAQSRDRSGLGLGAGSSRRSNLSYLLSQAQGSRASSMRRGSGMSPFSLTLSR